MGVGRFLSTRRSASQLHLELAGELDERTILACEAEARAELSVVKPSGVTVLVDLVEVHGYSLAARDGLVALQGHLRVKASQTAYVANSAASRGLALWVMHTTEGQVIKCFARREDAEAWLAGSAGPSTGVRPVARARDPLALPPDKKKAHG